MTFLWILGGFILFLFFIARKKNFHTKPCITRLELITAKCMCKV